MRSNSSYSMVPDPSLRHPQISHVGRHPQISHVPSDITCVPCVSKTEPKNIAWAWSRQGPTSASSAGQRRPCKALPGEGPDETLPGRYYQVLPGPAGARGGPARPCLGTGRAYQSASSKADLNVSGVTCTRSQLSDASSSFTEISPEPSASMRANISGNMALKVSIDGT
jgi:hypothetical protein